MPRQFKGYTFGNPDHDAHRDLLEIVHSGREVGTISPTLPATGGWGSLVTSDEIRYSLMNGNGRLTTVDGSYLTNENLNGFVDQTARAIAEELEHDIYPVLNRHVATGQERRIIENHARWYDSHDFESQDIPNKFYITTRRRPIIQLLKWDFVNPVELSYNQGRQTILDLMPRARVTQASGILRSVGLYGTGFGFNDGNMAIRSARVQAWGRTKHPNCFYIDFVSGYDHSSRVPAELREVIGLIVAIKVMSIYGDGRAAGVASFSISAGVLHESISTTQSATSAMYGARILQLEKQLKEWYERHASRYKPIRLAIL